MSKVLKVVAIVAVAVAVVVFAPAIGAALASVAGSLGITVAGSAIASYLVGMAITTALTATLTLFRKAPSMSNSMADRLSTSVNPTAPRKIVFGLTAAGNDVRFFETYGKKKDRYAQAVALASHRINAIRGFYVENDLVWSGGGLASHSDGIESVRAVTEGRPGNGFNLGSGSFWRSTASFTGCAYIAITWKLSSDAWPSGIPSSSRTIVEGCPLYDPRLDSTRGGSGSHRIDNQDTWGWRNGGVEIGRNPALALLTYLVGWRINGKLVWGMGIPAANIDFDSFRTYANICEEQVATQGGGSVQCYQCDGIFSTADAHDTVINAITAAMGSTKMVDVGGAYTLIGGYDDTAGPKVGLTLDDIVGAAGSSTPYVWLPAPASRERFNIVRGRFADPDNLYQLSDWGDPIEQPALADDVPRTMNLDLGCVSRPETCQRIAKQFLLREYLTPGKFSATFGPNAFAAQVGSIVTLTILQMGWNAKLFRVEEQAETHDMFYQMTLREESAAIYSWDREEKPLPANIRPTGYDPNDTLAPEAFAITSESYAGANGYNVSEVHVSWTPEDSGRVTGIQIYSRPVGVDAWTEQAALHDARTGSFIFTSNAPGIDIEVRARFRMSNAIYGQWVTATVATAPVVISYDNLNGTPNNLADINPVEGGKLGGIEAGATVGGVIGGNIKNPDGTLYVPPSRDQLVDTVAPAIPTGLTITSKLTDVGATLDFAWNAVSDSDLAGYVIAIKQGSGNYIEFTTGSNSYTRDALPRGTGFTAKVSAYDKAGNDSGFGAEVSITTARDDIPPAAPTQLNVDAAYSSAFLAWQNPADTDLAQITIRVYDANSNVIATRNVAAVPGGTGSFTISSLAKATTYKVNLQAYDTSGNASPYSDTFTFTTAGGIDVGDFTPGLQPIQTVASLPNPAGYSGPSVVLLQSDRKLYRYAAGAWTKEVQGSDIAPGAIDSTKLVDGSVGSAKIAAGVVGSDKLTAVNRPFTINGLNIRIDADGVMRWDNATAYYQKSDGSQAVRNIAAGGFGAGQGVVRLYFYIGDDGSNTNLDSRSYNDLSLDNNPVYKRIATWNGGTDLVVAEGVGIVWNGDQIVANTIKGKHIAASTISTANLLIADSLNYCENPDFAMGQVGNEYGNSVVESDAGKAYRGTFYCRALGDGVVRNKALMKVNPGDQLYGYAYINQTSYADGNSYVRFSGVDASGTERWTNVGQRVTGGTSRYGADAYQRVEVADAVPAGMGVIAVRVEVVHYTGNGEVFIGMMGLMRKNAGNLIVDGAITATKIATGAIEADKIASNSIAAGKLVVASRPISVTGINIRIDNDNVVRWDYGAIAFQNDAGNWVSYPINAGGAGWGGWGAPVNFCFNASTNSAALGIYYSQDVTSGYYGQQIPLATWSAGGKDFVVKSGTATLINGGNLVTGSINADKIAARTIGAAQIATGSLTANEIATGTITAAQIATDAITARTLAVGNNDNIVPDGDFRDPYWWNTDAPDSRLTVGDVPFTYFRRALFLTPGGGIDVFSNWFTVDSGATYKITMAAEGNVDNFQPLIHMPGIQWYSMIDGGGVDPANPRVRLTGSFSNTWTTTYTVPEGNNIFNQWQFRLMGSWGGTVKFAVKIVRVSDSTLIKDGAITTEKITVNSLNGDRIQAGTLNADKLNATSVLAGTITVGTQGTLNDIAQKAQNGTPLTFTQYQGIYTINGNYITKNGGGDQWDYNGWVDSPQRSSFVLSGKFPSVSTFIGVRQGQGYAVYSGFEYAWHRSSNGNWYIFESGNAVFADTKGGGIVFSDATVFRIEYAGNVINYWADAGLVRSVPCAPNLTFNAGFAIATPGSSLRFLNWSAGNDNSLINTDPAARINGYSTNILPGKITIQDGTTLDSWRDATEIRGGAIKTNSISAEKIAINARGITALGLDFRYEAGRLWWSAGHVLYTDDNGNAASPYIDAGSVAWAGGSYNYILWDKGAGGFRHVVDAWEQGQTRNTNTVIMVTWRNGSNFVANYGGTIVNGDRIVTRSIDASRIQAGTIGAYEIAAGSITADRMSVGSLSAISGNIGSLVSYNGQGGRVERDGNGTRIYDNNGTLRSWSGF